MVLASAPPARSSGGITGPQLPKTATPAAPPARPFIPRHITDSGLPAPGHNTTRPPANEATLSELIPGHVIRLDPRMDMSVLLHHGLGAGRFIPVDAHDAVYEEASAASYIVLKTERARHDTTLDMVPFKDGAIDTNGPFFRVHGIDKYLDSRVGVQRFVFTQAENAHRLLAALDPSVLKFGKSAADAFIASTVKAAVDSDRAAAAEIMGNDIEPRLAEMRNAASALATRRGDASYGIDAPLKSFAAALLGDMRKSALAQPPGNRIFVSAPSLPAKGVTPAVAAGVKEPAPAG